MVWRKQLAWQKEQEDSLLFVALTRSKSELFIVGSPDWLPKNPDDASTVNNLRGICFAGALPYSLSSGSLVLALPTNRLSPHLHSLL